MIFIKDWPRATTPDNGRRTSTHINYFDRHACTVEQYVRPSPQIYRRHLFPNGIEMVELMPDAGARNMWRHAPDPTKHGFTATRYCISLCPFVRAHTKQSITSVIGVTVDKAQRANKNGSLLFLNKTTTVIKPHHGLKYKVSASSLGLFHPKLNPRPLQLINWGLRHYQLGHHPCRKQWSCTQFEAVGQCRRRISGDHGVPIMTRVWCSENGTEPYLL